MTSPRRKRRNQHACRMPVPVAAVDRAEVQQPGRFRHDWGDGGRLTRSDIQLIAKAVRGSWNVPSDLRPALVEALMTTIESRDGSAHITAVSVIMLMLRKNREADLAAGIDIWH